MSIEWTYSKADHSIIVLVAELLKLIAPSFPKRRTLYLNSKSFDYAIGITIASSRYV